MREKIIGIVTTIMAAEEHGDRSSLLFRHIMELNSSLCLPSIRDSATPRDGLSLESSLGSAKLLNQTCTP